MTKKKNYWTNEKKPRNKKISNQMRIEKNQIKNIISIGVPRGHLYVILFTLEYYSL